MSSSPVSKRARKEPGTEGEGVDDELDGPNEDVTMAISSCGGRVGLAWVEGQRVRPHLPS